MRRRTAVVLIGFCLALLSRAYGQVAIDASKQAGAALKDGKPIEGPADWATSVGLGTTLTTGNSETLNATGRIATEKMHGSTLASILLEGAYGDATTTDDEGVKTTDQTVGNARTALSVKQRMDGLFVYGGVGAEHDVIAAVDYRTTLGIGLGTFLVDEGGIRLSIESGVGYLFEEVADVADDYATLRLAERLEGTLSETSKAWQSTEYLPEAAELDNYLLTSEAGIEAVITGKMNLALIVRYKYDSTPGEGLEKDDLSLTTQIAFHL